MLYALRYPLSFAVLVGAFVLGLCARGVVQRAISGQHRPAWARKLTRRRSVMWLKPFVDPYGCVAAVVAGPGWGSPVEVNSSMRRPPGRALAQLVAGPAVLAAMGIAALEGFRTWAGGRVVASGILSAVYHGDVFVGPFLTQGGKPSDPHFHYVIGFGKVALFIAGVEWLTMGVLAIMPLPPLDGGRLLFALAPRTMGWQQARFRLDDENWGALILLVLALPVLFRVPLMISLLDYIIDPLVRLVA